MTGGLEHKDERLHVAEGADWRDKLAELRDELPDDDDETDTGSAGSDSSRSPR